MTDMMGSRPYPLITGPEDGRDVAYAALSERAEKAIAAVIAKHDDEFVAALAPLGYDWHQVAMPGWMRFVTLDDARAAVARRDADLNKEHETA